MDCLSSGWIDCGVWHGANGWRWTPEAGEIPQEALDLLQLVSGPSVLFDLEITAARLKTEKASLYIAVCEDEIVGAFVVSISDVYLFTKGRIFNIEAGGFLPGQASGRWDFIVSLAKINGCALIQTVSSRPLHKVFPSLKPCEIVFFSEV